MPWTETYFKLQMLIKLVDGIYVLMALAAICYVIAQTVIDERRKRK